MASFHRPHEKLALVIGINNYPREDKLKYCIKDAEDMADKLKSIGFTVTSAIDCNKKQFEGQISKFVENITSDNLVLFYFAGHGCQFEDKNYLLPAGYSYDHSMNERKYIEENGISAQYILHKIECKGAKATIFILDCCRIYVSYRSINTSRGLGSIKGPSESLIAFSCGFNQGSIDDTLNDRNGIFTEHLLKYIATPDQDIETILQMVACEVKSKGFPIPFRTSSLTEKIYLMNRAVQNEIDRNPIWKEDGIIVAGGNDFGKGLNQLYFPAGLCITEDQTIYIADWFNSRIVEWKIGEKSGTVVAGGNGDGNRNEQLHFPTDVIFDKNRDCFFICDTGNKRIVQWPRRNAQIGTTIITGVTSYGLAMDENGFLYISDHEKDEVRRWQVGDVQGKLVAGGNGRGDRFDQLHCPVSVFVDRNHSVYVSDYRNERVVKWVKNATQGILIACCKRLAKASSDHFHPRGIIVDQFGSVIVADATNHQIARWQKNQTEGTVIIGSRLRNSKPDQLNHPIGLSVDLKGNLYVCEHQNHRVQMFKIDRASLHSS